VEAGRVVELVAALGAPVPHLYFAGRFIEEFNRVGDSLGFSLGYLALVDKRASRVRRVRACRCEKENREYRRFQKRFHAPLRFRIIRRELKLRSSARPSPIVIHVKNPPRYSEVSADFPEQKPAQAQKQSTQQ
jgi:hypothetical protein